MLSKMGPFLARIYYDLDGPVPASTVKLTQDLPTISPNFSENPNPTKEFDDKFLELINTEPRFFSNQFPFRAVILENVSNSDLLEKLVRSFESYFRRLLESTVHDPDHSIMQDSLKIFLRNSNLNIKQQDRLAKCFLKTFGLTKNITKSKILEAILAHPNYKANRTVRFFNWTDPELERLCQVACANPNSSLAAGISNLKLTHEQFAQLINAAQKIKVPVSRNRNPKPIEVIDNLANNPEIYKAGNHDIANRVIALLDETIIHLDIIRRVSTQVQLDKIAEIYKRRNHDHIIDEYFINALAKNTNFTIEKFTDFLLRHTSYQGLGLEYRLSRHHSKPGIDKQRILGFFDFLEKTSDERDDKTWYFAKDLIHCIPDLSDDLFHRLVKLSTSKFDERNGILPALAFNIESSKQIDNLIDIVDEIRNSSLDLINSPIHYKPHLDEEDIGIGDFIQHGFHSFEVFELLTKNSEYHLKLKDFIENLLANKNISFSQMKRLLTIINPIMKMANLETSDLIKFQPYNRLKTIFVDQSRNDDHVDFERFIQLAKKYPLSLSGKVYAHAIKDFSLSL